MILESISKPGVSRRGVGALRVMGLLWISAYALTWMTPCVSTSVRSEPAAPAHAGASTPHDPHRDHAAQTAADRSGHASLPSRDDGEAGDREGGDTFVVEACACGCASRPQAAGTTTAPGHALLLQRWAAAPFPVAMERMPASDTAVFPTAADPIEHVPIRVLS